MRGWCESDDHDLDDDEDHEGDFYMCRAGQSAPGVRAMDYDRFVFLCEAHQP